MLYHVPQVTTAPANHGLMMTTAIAWGSVGILAAIGAILALAINRRRIRGSRVAPKSYKEVDGDLARDWERGKGESALKWEQSNQGQPEPYEHAGRSE